MKKLVKKVALLSLAIVTVLSIGCGALACSGTANKVETRAEQFADDIEKLVEETGKKYEDNAEAYPGNAKNDPDANAKYLENVKKISGGFMSGLRNLFKK